MPPAIPFLAAALSVAGGLAGGIAGAVLTVLSVGVSILGQTVFRPRNRGLDRGQELSLTLDPVYPREIVIGQTAIGGSVVWANTTGQNNRLLYRVIALSDYPVSGLAQLLVDGQGVTFTGNPATGYAPISAFRTSRGAPRIAVRFYDGHQTQADPELRSAFGSSYGADRVLRGAAYAIVRLEWDADVFTRGEPAFVFVIDGVAAYDPRLDSTAGGAGAHRVSQPGTWAFTANPALLLAQYLRGWPIGSSGLIGVGETSPGIVDLATAANICDEMQAGAAGAVPRYRCGGVISAGDTHREVIDDLLLAMGGIFSDRGGRLRILPGAVFAPVLHLVDGDLSAIDDASYSEFGDFSENYNAVTARFVDPANNWQEQAAPIRENPQFVLDDGGERVERDLALRLVTSASQANRLAERALRASRYQARVTVSGAARLIELEPGDWITWSSDRYGWTDRLWQVSQVAFSEDLRVQISLSSIGADVDEWDSDIDGPIVYGSSSDAGEPTLIVSGFSAVGAILVGSGIEEPAIRVNWSPIVDPYARRALLEIRAAGSTDSQVVPIDPPSGQTIVRAGILPGMVYEFRARAEGADRVGPWTDWDSASAPATSTLSDLAANPGARTYFQTAAPTDARIGDLWRDSDDLVGGLYRWTGSAWDLVSTSGAVLGSNIVDLTGSVVSPASVITSEGTAADAQRLGGQSAAAVAASIAAAQTAADAVATLVAPIPAQISSLGSQVEAVEIEAEGLAAAVEVIEAQRGAQYLRDPLFLTGVDGWIPANAVTLVDGSPRAIEAASAITIRWPGTYAIGARGRIDVSADVIGAITLAVVWRDAAGVETRAVIGSGAAGRIGGIQTAPAGTIGLRVEGDCAAGARLSRPQIAAAASEQVQFAAFLDPQDAQTTRILSDRIASAELGLARTRVESQAGGASASASIALSTSATLDGRLSAIAGVQTEVAGRAGGIVIANDGAFVGVQVRADGFFVRGVSGAVIAAFREASGGGIELADTMIRSLLVTPVGGGPAHRVALRPNRVSGQHGQAIIYSAAYSAIPLVEYAGQTPALAAGESYFVGPAQSTTTGFVVRAVKFTPGSSTVVNTGFGLAAGGTPRWRVSKPEGLSAFDNQYQFTGEASAAGKPQNVFSGDQQLYSATATIAFYYLINGVSTLVTTLTFSNDGFYSPEDTFGLPEIAIPFAATIQIAQNLSVFGAQFGVDTTDAAITAFSNVSYTTQTASNESVLAGQFTFDVFPPG